jgi:hypothetical protein
MIKKLTKKQERELIEFRQKWWEVGISSKPADWDRAERAIYEICEIENLKRPHIVRCASPLTAEFLINILSNKALGASLRASQ